MQLQANASLAILLIITAQLAAQPLTASLASPICIILMASANFVVISIQAARVVKRLRKHSASAASIHSISRKIAFVLHALPLMLTASLAQKITAINARDSSNISSMLIIYAKLALIFRGVYIAQDLMFALNACQISSNRISNALNAKLYLTTA